MAAMQIKHSDEFFVQMPFPLLFPRRGALPMALMMCFEDDSTNRTGGKKCSVKPVSTLCICIAFFLSNKNGDLFFLPGHRDGTVARGYLPAKKFW